VEAGLSEGAYVTSVYATADGSATAGSDYVAMTGTLRFPPGTVSQSVRVSILRDNLVEPDEIVFLNLSNATGVAAVADGQGVGTIHDGIDRLGLTHMRRTETAPAPGQSRRFSQGRARRIGERWRRCRVYSVSG
jgi:hypothetical protein